MRRLKLKRDPSILQPCYTDLVVCLACGHKGAVLDNPTRSSLSVRCYGCKRTAVFRLVGGKVIESPAMAAVYQRLKEESKA